MAVAKAAPSHHSSHAMPPTNRTITVSVSEQSCEFIDQLASQHEGTLTKQGVVRLLLQQAEQIGWDPLDRPLILDRRAAASLSSSSSSLEKNKKKSISTVSLIERVPAELSPYGALIQEFWGVKKGSKGETAFSLLIENLLKIRAKYGPEILEEQLKLGINGKFNTVSLSNYEKFGRPAAPTARQPQERKSLTEQARELGMI